MQPKTGTKDKFNDQALGEGIILLKQGPQYARMVRPSDIRNILGTNGAVHIYLQNENLTIRTNFDLVIEAYLRAKNHGEAIDLRDICFLPETDKLHKFYVDASMPEVIMEELRQRVKTLRTKPF